MPFIKEFYTGLKLIQNINQYVKVLTFKQNQILFTEHNNKEFKNNTGLFIIEKGQLNIYKKIKFMNQDDVEVTKDEVIMTTQQGEIVGEE